ncbi:MAG: cytochrome c oxidase subunit II [Planctomycetaceae bacterium]|nr:cytochrome c oxidase subunit II [Planctomycetaceae bacterium]
MNDADLQLFPEAASTIAPRIDALFWFITGITVVLSLAIAVMVVFLAIRYRRKNDVDRTPYLPNKKLEMAWLIGPLPILLVIFFWSAQLFFEIRRAPHDSMQVAVVGRQWMWKFQQPTGRREIDVLHVPVNRPVQLTMISQDVIHSFYVPAFRIKQDVLPGTYTTAWFEADKVGTYHLFCAEYCGTSHSRMVGKIVVMSQADYENWLAGGKAQEMPAVAGGRLFEQYRCGSCHMATETQPARAPSLAGLFGKPVRLADGRTATADQEYLRESILRPNDKIVAGYQPLMPTFQGQIDEEGVLQLIAYIKSLDPASSTGAHPAAGATGTAAGAGSPPPAVGPSGTTPSTFGGSKP